METEQWRCWIRFFPLRGTHLQIICARFHLYCSPGKVAALCVAIVVWSMRNLDLLSAGIICCGYAQQQCQTRLFAAAKCIIKSRFIEWLDYTRWEFSAVFLG
jgi:hypothetical protein